MGKEKTNFCFTPARGFNKFYFLLIGSVFFKMALLLSFGAYQLSKPAFFVEMFAEQKRASVFTIMFYTLL